MTMLTIPAIIGIVSFTRRVEILPLVRLALFAPEINHSCLKIASLCKKQPQLSQIHSNLIDGEHVFAKLLKEDCFLKDKASPLQDSAFKPVKSTRFYPFMHEKSFGCQIDINDE